MKQSAVEWLVQEINKINVSTEARRFINKLEKQAKEMEKQQGYSEEIIQLELLIKSQEELKEKGVLTNEGIGYLNGLKTAFEQLKKK